MLVKVILLRHEGVSLAADSVQQQTGVVGTIRLRREPGGRVGEWRRQAILSLPHGQALELHAAQLVRWDERGLVLAGEEQQWHRRECKRYRQAWWCRPVDAAGGRERADPIDEDEEREQVALAD
jgi:hypothetical protein